jgi:hypothetical protein
MSLPAHRRGRSVAQAIDRTDADRIARNAPLRMKAFSLVAAKLSICSLT